MRFFGIVTLTIALLQREGRITYRALKRGFELDDAALEDLRRELIFRMEDAVDCLSTACF